MLAIEGVEASEALSCEDQVRPLLGELREHELVVGGTFSLDQKFLRWI